MNIDQAREILEEYRWQHPDSYAGFSPDHHYHLMSIHRDSKVLDESNWETMKRLLQEAGCPVDEYLGEEEEPFALTWRASHWAVGWIEHMVIADDAPEAALIEAAEALCSLSGYPVLDEDDWTERELEAVCEWWEQESLKWRIEMCQYSGESIFAARRGYPPERVEERLREQV